MQVKFLALFARGPWSNAKFNYAYWFALMAVPIASLFWAFDIPLSWGSVLWLVVGMVFGGYIVWKLLPIFWPKFSPYLDAYLKKHRAVWDERLKECGGDEAVLDQRYHIKRRVMIYWIAMIPTLVIIAIGYAWLTELLLNFLEGKGLVQ
jgi:hypothetical protein